MASSIKTIEVPRYQATISFSVAADEGTDSIRGEVRCEHEHPSVASAERCATTSHRFAKEVLNSCMENVSDNGGKAGTTSFATDVIVQWLSEMDARGYRTEHFSGKVSL